MEIECVKDKLKNALVKVNRTTGKHASLPVLSYILIIAEQNKIILRSTNLDVGVEIEMAAKVKKEGSVAVPGTVLGQLLGTLQKDKTVTLSGKEGNVYIKTDSSETTITGVNGDDFPTLPVVNNGDGFEVDAECIVHGVRSVVYSASTSDIKPELSSVYMYGEGGGIKFVATDSFRLAEKSISIKNIRAFPGVLIPFKNANEIATILEDVNGSVDVLFSGTQIAVSAGDIYITSRLVDATFPDYKQIIPTEESTQAVLLKQDVMNVLKINTIFANKFNQIFIHINPKNKEFSIQTKNTQLGENKTRIDGSLSGELVDMSVNYKYINDALPTIKSDSISLSFNGGNKPVIIKGVDDNTFRYLVMPMNR